MEKAATPVVALSASKGGSSIAEWQPGTSYYTDLITRINDAKTWLTKQQLPVRRTILLWLQGETDGDLGRSFAEYKDLTENFLCSLLKEEVDEVFLLEIGNQRSDAKRYEPIRKAQHELGSLANVTFIPTSLKNMAESGEMIDEFHFTQQAYNQCGQEVASVVLELLGE